MPTSTDWFSRVSDQGPLRTSRERIVLTLNPTSVPEDSSGWIPMTRDYPQPCWKLLRPVCGLHPRRRLSRRLKRPNVSAPPVGFEPTTQGLGNLCSIP
jgi:hypothetical protein